MARESDNAIPTRAEKADSVGQSTRTGQAPQPISDSPLVTTRSRHARVPACAARSPGDLAAARGDTFELTLSRRTECPRRFQERHI